MALGIGSHPASTSGRIALFGIALGASFRQAWQKLCRRIARRGKRHAVAELDDWLLRDIGVIRERDIGVGADAARQDVDKLLCL